RGAVFRHDPGSGPGVRGTVAVVGGQRGRTSATGRADSGGSRRGGGHTHPGKRRYTSSRWCTRGTGGPRTPFVPGPYFRGRLGPVGTRRRTGRPFAALPGPDRGGRRRGTPAGPGSLRARSGRQASTGPGRCGGDRACGGRTRGGLSPWIPRPDGPALGGPPRGRGAVAARSRSDHGASAGPGSPSRGGTCHRRVRSIRAPTTPRGP